MTPFIALILMLNPPPYTPNHAGQYYMAPIINYYSDLYLVPRWWAMETAHWESSFRPKLVTYKVVLNTDPRVKDFDKLALYRKIPISRGLFQGNLAHEAEHAKNAGIRNFVWSNPEHSARMGIALLDRLRRYYHGDLILASAAYNAGIGRINSAKPIPAETVDYLDKIFKEGREE